MFIGLVQLEVKNNDLDIHVYISWKNHPRIIKSDRAS